MDPPQQQPLHHRISESHAALESAEAVLRGFVHRNRNQHRGGRWWGQLGLVRRHARRLAADLHAAQGRARRAEERRQLLLVSGGGAKTKKRKREGDGSNEGKQGGQQKEDEDGKEEDGTETLFAPRARWLRDECIPRAYFAFTQLVADNQYAALGLLLIGVLAQINAAVALLVGDGQPASPALSASGEGDLQEAGAEVANADAVTEMDIDGGVNVDVGVAVSRDEVEREVRRQRRQKQERGRDDEAAAASTAAAITTTTATTVAMAATVTARTEVASEDQPIDEAGPKKKKKKKRKKGGDEFDDLFSSLI